MAVAAISGAIVTWSEYKTIFGINDNADQDKYQTLINQASARMELYCKRNLKARDYLTTNALYLDGSGMSNLVVPHWPINSITSLKVDTLRAFGTDTLVAVTDYSYRDGIIRLYSGTFPGDESGLDAVKLEGNFGYATTTSEWQVLQTACLELARWMSSRFTGGGFIGKRNETNADGMSVGFEIDMPMNVRSMLEPFVERRI